MRDGSYPETEPVRNKSRRFRGDSSSSAGPWLWLILSCVLVAGIVYHALQSHRDFKETILSNLEHQQGLLAKAMQTIVYGYIEEAREKLLYLVKEGAKEEASLPEMLSSMYQAHDDDFQGLAVVDVNGGVVLSHPDNVVIDKGLKKFIGKVALKPRGEGEAFLSERVVLRDRVDVSLVLPFPQRGGELDSFLVGILKIEAYMLERSPMLEKSSTCLILSDAGGDIISLVNDSHTTPRGMIGGNLYSLDEICLNCHKKGDFSDVKRALLSDDIVNAVCQLPDGGITNRTTIPFLVADRKWLVSVCSPFGDAQSRINANFRNNMTYALLSLLALSSIGVVTHASQKKRAVLEAEKENLDKIARVSEALRRSEERSRTFIEAASDYLYILNEEGIITYANESMAGNLGYTKEEMIGMDIARIVGEGPAGNIHRLKREDLASEGRISGSLVLLARDGRRISGEVKVVAISGNGGRYAGERAIFRDMTQKEESDRELRKSEEIFRTIVTNANAIIFMIDRDGVFLLSEGKGLSALNLKPGEVVGRSAYEMYRDHPPIVRGIKEALKGKVFRDKIEVQGVFFDIFYSPFRDSGGVVTGTLGMAVDVTESMRAKAALERSEERYRALFEESTDSILITTPAGNIVEANLSAVDLLGYDGKTELYQLDIRHDLYVEPGDRDRFQSLIAGKGFVENFETVLRRKNGERITVLITGNMVGDEEGKSVRYRVSVRDITEQRRLQTQLLQAQKMESIGTLAGGIAHDFNNILGAIMGYSELTLIDLPESTDAHENISEVLKATYRARDIVKQILAFSRKTKETHKPVAVHDVIKEALRLLRASIPATITIRSDIDTGSGNVLADPNQLHQVIMNLCTNAHHAMRKEGGSLRIKLRGVVLDRQSAMISQRLAEGPYVQLTISDSGHGMDEQTVKRIFEPYFTTKGKEEGSGLGLAVVHGIVDSYGGTVTVESVPGEGSTFTILLPRIEAERDKKPPGRDSELPRGTEKVLFVDDELPLARLGEKMLEKLGYEVTLASSGVEALEKVKADSAGYDIVITDQTMAGITGAKLAEELLEMHPELPIVICTGYSDILDEVKAREMGVKALLMKPLDINKLAETVRKALNSRSGR